MGRASLPKLDLDIDHISVLILQLIRIARVGELECEGGVLSIVDRRGHLVAQADSIRVRHVGEEISITGRRDADVDTSTPVLRRDEIIVELKGAIASNRVIRKAERKTRIAGGIDPGVAAVVRLDAER